MTSYNSAKERVGQTPIPQSALFIPWAVLLCSFTLIPQAQGQTSDKGLVSPTRLTSGASDQYRGELAPNGKDLYYVSNANATTEIWYQDLTLGAPTLLFDHYADVLDPMVSPDGKRLLFISYRSDALGDVCIRDMKEGAINCITGPGTAETSAFWFPDGQHIGHVSRGGINTDFMLFRRNISSDESQVLLKANMSNPTLSPDGQWLAYTPLDRVNTAVGVNFSASAHKTLKLLHLATTKEITLQMPLPGKSAIPAFSRDGKFLYFSQYLNDTNLDGTIDGDDNSVIFRIPFDPKQLQQPPEQLTSALWNCQYPSPAKDRLIVTCSHEGSLDIYSLPFTGSLPPEWNMARLEEEMEVSRNHWNKLLLLGRMVALEGSPERKGTLYRRIVMLHTDLKEHESAEFYLQRVREIAKPQSYEAQWAGLMMELVGFRREELGLSRGLLTEAFVAAQRERLARLEAPLAANLSRLVRMEILSVLGDKGHALALLREIDLAAERDPLVLALFGDRPASLLRLMGEREALLQAYRTLASRDILSPMARLAQGDRFVSELTRGRGKGQRRELLEEARGRAEEGSELAMRLELELWLLRMDELPVEEVRKGIFEIYKRNREVERRKMLVTETIRSALSQDREFLLYQFSNTWVSWLQRSRSERRFAEEIYRQVVLERAYMELAKRNFSDARGYFYGGTLQTDSLDTHIGFIEARYAEGKGETVKEEYGKRFEKNPNDPVHRFVQAYLVARELGGITDPVLALGKIITALIFLREAGEQRPQDLYINLLWGYLSHREYLLTMRAEASSAAQNKYLLALDLARTNPRFQANIHHDLGLLAAEMGNHYFALSHFDERLKLTFIDPANHLNLLMARARSLMHIGRDEEAAKVASQALELIQSTRELEPFGPLALDRAALYHYLHGDYKKALDLYEGYGRLLESANSKAHPVQARLNRLKHHLASGAAALGAGQGEKAITHLLEGNKLLDELGPLRLPPTMHILSITDLYQPDRDDYRTIGSGLLAQAYAATGRLEEAQRWMTTRLELLDEKMAMEDRQEILLEMAKAQYHLASYALRQRRFDEALHRLEQGLAKADQFATATGSPANQAQLRLLPFLTALRVDGAGQTTLDLRARLRELHGQLCKLRNPKARAERFLVASYLTLLDLEGKSAPPGSP